MMQGSEVKLSEVPELDGALVSLAFQVKAAGRLYLKYTAMPKRASDTFKDGNAAALNECAKKFADFNSNALCLKKCLRGCSLRKPTGLLPSLPVRRHGRRAGLRLLSHKRRGPRTSSSLACSFRQ